MTKQVALLGTRTGRYKGICMQYTGWQKLTVPKLKYVHCAQEPVNYIEQLFNLSLISPTHPLVCSENEIGFDILLRSPTGKQIC